MELITIYLKHREKPIEFEGEYKGHIRPDGKETKNWHYYLDNHGYWRHFRKTEIQAVISSKV